MNEFAFACHMAATNAMHQRRVRPLRWWVRLLTPRRVFWRQARIRYAHIRGLVAARGDKRAELEIKIDTLAFRAIYGSDWVLENAAAAARFCDCKDDESSFHGR